MHICISEQLMEKETMNLEESKEVSMVGFGWEKGEGGDDAVIVCSQK